MCLHLFFLFCFCKIIVAILTLKLRALKNLMDFKKKNTFAAERFNIIYHKRRRKMKAFREVDFGRYKKIMTYLGLRDRFNPSLMSPAVHRWAHVYSKRKPPGGRRSHIW